MSWINSCKNTPETISNDVCYGSHLEFFSSGKVYTRQQKINIISNNEVACGKCYNSLTNDEKHVCDLD